MTINNIKENLCYYDLRNPNGVIDSIIDSDEINDYGNYAKPNCSCDNCHYGRTLLAEELLIYKLKSLS